ncbi:unnamed protein product [Rhodiola kirilowii]
MWIFGRKGSSGFSASSTAEQVTQGIDASDLTAIVTGASSGIGVETTRVLALRGAHVVMAVRNVVAGKSICENICKENPNAKIDVMELDLSSMASVRSFASMYISSGLPLNILINNAGVMGTPFILSQDNIELQFATNHIGHFLLTHLLLDTMRSTAKESKREGRIVNVSSEGHRFAYSEGIKFDKINDESSYNRFRAYGQSKLANILHAHQLAKNLKEEGCEITANSVHPGAIATNIARYQNVPFKGFLIALGKYMVKNVAQGASTTCFVALSPQVKGVTGEYFMDNKKAEPNAKARSSELASKLWEFSLKLTQPVQD